MNRNQFTYVNLGATKPITSNFKILHAVFVDTIERTSESEEMQIKEL